jgi:phage gp45-like
MATKLFRGVFGSIRERAGKGLRLASLVVRGERELQDVPVMQQRGLVSMPQAGDVAMVAQIDDLAVVLGTDSKLRPDAGPGETVLYASETTFIRLKPDGSVHIQGSAATTIEMAPDGSIRVHGMKVTVEADSVASIIAPKVGLGHDGATANPLDGMVTGRCLCMFSGLPHPDVSSQVTASKGTP